MWDSGFGLERNRTGGMESEDSSVELALSTFTQVWSGDPWRQTLFWHPQLFGKSSHSAAPSPKAHACPTNKPAALAAMSPMTRMSAITLRLNPAPQILHSPK